MVVNEGDKVTLKEGSPSSRWLIDFVGSIGVVVGVSQCYAKVQFDSGATFWITFDHLVLVKDAPPPSPEGLRYDDGKPPLTLLDPLALEGTAAVLGFGAKKYSANNWKKGMAWSKVIGSLMRHTLKFISGEDLDPESGLPHVDHIMCNAMFLSYYYRKHKAKDDRYKEGT